MTTSCPSPEVLAGIGTSDGSCLSGVAAHIEGCRACQEFLERRIQEGLESLPPRGGSLPELEAVPHVNGFTIEAELGRGAMGVVYRARRDTLSRPVALKLLPGGRRAGPRERRQWLREAEAASSVRHPNVVTLYEVGEAEDCFLLVLEYIPGGTLADRLSGPLAPTAAARLLETIARAVHHVHRHGQLHLDLKPSNILLDGDPGAGWEAVVPKVSDFGIARAADAGMTDSGGIGAGGSPPYMAPEQIVRPRNEMSPAADIHALGAILYQMLTGRPPYRGATVLDTLEQVRNQEPVPPRRLVPRVPRDLETIALKCLEKNPAGRYASAEAMADDLRRWLDGRTISARPVSAVEQLWRRCCRRPMVAALAAALVLTLAIGFVGVVLLWGHAESERRRAEDELFFANLMLGEISSGGMSGSAQFLVLTRDDAIAVLRRTTDRVLRFRAEHPEDLATCQRLADLHLALAGHYEAQRNPEACRSSLVAGLENVDRVLQVRPRDRAALHGRFAACRMLATVAEQEGKSEESAVHLERAVAHGRECWRLGPGPGVLNALATCQWALAQRYSRRGDDEAARALVLDNLRLSDEVPDGKVPPENAIWRVLARLDLHQFHAGLPAAAGPRPGGDSPLSRLASTDADRLDAEGWADLVFRSLNASPGALDLSGDQAHGFIEALNERLAWRRRLGRIDDARRYADRMLAFGRLLVARHPDRPAAHLALSAAFKQVAKNAWHPFDRPVVERNWRLAIHEARRALVLDPRDARAGKEVADLQKRLDLLTKPKPKPASGGRDAVTPTVGVAGR